MPPCKVYIDRNRALSILAVSAAAFLVFLPWVQVYFLGDDWMLLARNSGCALPSQLRLISDASNSSQYRPLSELTLAWTWSLFGLNPAGYHVFNSLLHAFNAVLVAVLGYRLSGDRRVGLLAGLSFAMLGCHTEAVVWITARHEMLASALALLSTLSYIRFRESNRRAWWFSAFVLYVASLGFKETTLALPILFVFYDVIFVFPSQYVRSWRLVARHALPLLPPAMLGIAYGLFRFQVGGGYDVPFNVAALPKNLVYYLLMETVALPDSTRFLSRFPLATLPVIASLTFACALSVWLARRRLMRYRALWYSVLWMVFALAPVILIVAERTSYFSSVGWAWAIATIVILAWDALSESHFPSRADSALVYSGVEALAGNRLITPLCFPSAALRTGAAGASEARFRGGVHEIGNRYKRWLVVVPVVIILGANLVTLIHRSYWWSRAADISRDVISEVRASLLNLPPGENSQLWFFNFPDQIEYAYAFGDRIPFAVWLLQDQLDVDVEAAVFRNGEVDVPSVERVRQMLSERAVEGPIVAFYWQGETLLKLSTMEGSTSH